VSRLLTISTNFTSNVLVDVWGGGHQFMAHYLYHDLLIYIIISGVYDCQWGIWLPMGHITHARIHHFPWVYIWSLATHTNIFSRMQLFWKIMYRHSIHLRILNFTIYYFSYDRSGMITRVGPNLHQPGPLTRLVEVQEQVSSALELPSRVE